MSKESLTVRVECYAGYRGEETPRRFYIGERSITVVDVVDRWLDPDHRYFKVRGDDKCEYTLRHGVSADRWQVTLFDSGMREEIRSSST